MSGERVNDERIAPPEKDDLVDVDNLEIAPLSEEDLDAVVGGIGPLDSDCISQGESGGRVAT